MFNDRHEAGVMLAEKLAPLASDKPIVYALPRGGLPVAAPVAKRLDAPLDLILVRKLGAPQHKELAIGAVVDGANPITILNTEIIAELGVASDYIEATKAAALGEIERRRKLYFGNAAPRQARGRTVIIVDDGLATGSTMLAAAKAMRAAKAKKIIIAAPVAPAEIVTVFADHADEIVVLATPHPFHSVGAWYRSFPQLADSDVQKILRSVPDGSI